MRSLTKNMSISIVARIVTLVTGLIVQREILLAYGSTFNGLTSSITQVMSYLVLLEAGLGTASIQALYNPLAQRDWNSVSSILSATDREYRKITIAFFSILVLISALFPFVVSGQVEYWISSLMMLIIGGSYVVSYIVGGKYKALLSADRKIYVLYILDIITITLSCVLRIAALRSGYTIVWVQLLNLMCAVIKNIGYVIYVRRRYGEIDYNAIPDFKAVSKRWNVLVHSLAGIVVNHTDILILTAFADLKLVSVYSVYNMVFSQMSTLIQTTFSQAPQASFGRIMNRDKEEFVAAFHIYEWGFTVLLFILCTITSIMIIPFVSLYTHGVTDINYINHYLPVLFTLILLMNQIRTPSLIAINVCGAFKETQAGAITEAVINLTVSLLLFFLTKLGLYGLLIGTVCSYLFRTADVLFYTYRKILHQKIGKIAGYIFINFLLTVLLYTYFGVLHPIICGSYISWIINAVFISIGTIVVFLIVNVMIGYKELSKMRNSGMLNVHFRKR